MDHQDWKVVTLKGAGQPKAQAVRDGKTVSIKKQQVDRHAYKLENETENFEHDRVSHNLAQTIQQARSAKKWSRKELAQKLNVKENIIADYETGKAIPDGKLLQQLSRVLDVTLRKNM